jgi:hypothetical protein
MPFCVVKCRYGIPFMQPSNGFKETNRPQCGRQSNAKRTLCVNTYPGEGDEMEPEKKRKNLPSHFLRLQPFTGPIPINGSEGKSDPIEPYESHSSFH